MIPLSGTFYRIVFEQYADQVLQGVLSKEGRFHHDGEAAFYCSPSREAASIAIDRYLKPDDPARVIIELKLNDLNVVDIRPYEIANTVQSYPTLAGAEVAAAIPWLEDRDLGIRPKTWDASDAARATGADGMIYSSRKMPQRWHVVLFRWNCSQVQVMGQSQWP